MSFMPAVYGQVAPSITSSPTNQTTLPGRTVLLRAAATGTQPLTYQWQLNGTNLAGALGSTLTFSSVKQSDSGAYRVVVTNQTGNATSGAVVLSVVPVVAWGDNRSGQLKVPAEVTNAVRLAVGGTFCLALRADHKVVAWGGNAYGQTNVPATATNIIAVAAGSSHALAVRGDGTVVAWGSHGAGQTNVPAQATNVIAVAAGSSHSVALRRDGSVIAWGSGVSVTNVPAGVENIVAIAAGGIHTLALRSDGVVLAWGINTYGQTSVHGGASADVVQIAAGGNHSLALRTDGTVVAWGDNYYGQRSIGFTLNQVASIAAGNTHSIALKNDGTVVGWGEKPPIFTYVPYGLTNAPAGVSNIVELASAATVNLARIGDGSPQLVAGSVNVSGWQGGKVVLNGMAVGKPPLYYQWLFNGGKIPGATQPSLTLTNLQLAQAGEYSIVVTGPNGVITHIAATVQVLTPPVPMIVTHPASASVPAGTNVTFSATIGRVPAVFQWQFNGTNLTGRTRTSLTLTNVQSAEAGEYRVIVSNISGSSTSQVAVLAITPAPPAILTQPQNLIIVPGLAATFAVTARGTTPLAYQWQFNEADISGATSPSLDFPMVRSSDAGSYRVIITNAIGAITSSVATLATVPIVVWGANTDGLKNVPTATSNAVALAAGRDHLLALRADGTVIAWGNNSSGQTTDTPAATNIAAVVAGDGHNLVLQTDGSVFAWGNNADGQVNIPPTASNVLAITAGSRHNLALRIDGTVVGWGNNSHGQVNIPATATNVIAIAAGGRHSLALNRDGTIMGWGDNFWGQRNFPASATGLVALAARDLNSLALRKDGKPIAWGTFRPNTDYPALATSLVAIAVGSYHSLAVRDDATAVAWGSDFSGETKLPPGLTNVAAIAGGSLFSAAFSQFSPPRLGVQPASRIANAGADVVFHIAAAGALPLTYQWLANGTFLPGATDGSLQLMNVQSSASYQLIVLNQSGSVTSAPIVLTLQPAAPWIKAEPVNASAGLGSTASFHVHASGSEPLNFRWLFHGTNLLNGDRIAGAASPGLFISNLDTNDVGPYFVRVSNTFGSVTSQVASLDVALPPEIVQSPTNHTLPAGTNATFSVTATGTPPLAYQWRFNLMALVNRTNATLTLTNVQAVNVGDYDVVVVNPYGAATSEVAALTILPSAPVITLHPTSRTVTAGNGTTFSSRASGSEPLRYQWLFNGVALPGATAINLSVANVQTVNAGQYRVVATNDFGAVTSSIATLTVSASGPTIATHPKDLVITRGMSASFNVVARGSNPLGYQWQRNGSPIPGATGSSFTLNPVQPENAGAYRVLVNNPSGSLVSIEAALSIVSVAAWGQST